MSREIMQMALATLKNCLPVNYCYNNFGEASPMYKKDGLSVEKINESIKSLEDALAQPEQESKPIYVMGNYAGEGKVVSASFGLPKGAFEFAPHTGKGEASKIKHSLESQPAQPEPQVCCGDYEKCMKACTPRGRWLANKQITRFEQEKKQFVGGIPEVSQQRDWVGLTDDEKESVYKHADAENHQLSKVVSAVEWLLKNKNTTNQ